MEGRGWIILSSDIQGNNCFSIMKCGFNPVLSGGSRVVATREGDRVDFFCMLVYMNSKYEAESIYTLNSFKKDNRLVQEFSELTYEEMDNLIDLEVLKKLLSACDSFLSRSERVQIYFRYARYYRN